MFGLYLEMGYYVTFDANKFKTLLKVLKQLRMMNCWKDNVTEDRRIGAEPHVSLCKQCDRLSSLCFSFESA